MNNEYSLSNQAFQKGQSLNTNMWCNPVYPEDMSDSENPATPESLPDLLEMELGNYSQEQQVSLALIQTCKNEQLIKYTLLEIYTLRAILLGSMLLIIFIFGICIFFFGEKLSK